MSEGTTPNERPSFIETLPEEYRDKPYLQNINDIGGLLNQFDNAQKLIGKKSIPGDDATPEEWNEFYKRLGHPDSPEGYDYAPEIEGVEEEALKGELAIMKDFFHKANLTPKQAQSLLDQWAEGYKSSIEKSKELEAQKDAEFEDISNEVFGAEKEVVLEESKELIKSHLPEQFKEHFNSLDNKSLLLLAGVINGISKEYIKTGKAPTGGQGSGIQSPEQLRAKAISLMNERAKLDNTTLEFERLTSEINEIYKQLPS